MNVQPATEQRHLKRWQLIYYLRVFDQEKETLLGHAVDVSTAGLQLASEWPIPVKQVYHLWMEVPRDSGDSHRINFKAFSLWSNPDETPGFYKTGLRLVEPSPASTDEIRKLIDAL